jgi:tRNA A-37 threonylcarbamoyl transferase component Bud32
MRFHRDTMYIAPAGRERLRRAGLDTVDRVLKCLGHQVVAWSRSTETVRVDLPAEAGAGAVFVKRYHLLRWKVRIKAMFRGAFFGRSRAHAEFDRLERMRAAGAPVVDPVAWGERRILHFVRFSFLITEAVDGAVSLTTFAQDHADGQRRPLSARDRRALIESLGRCIGQLHGRGLAHGALFWRNILVRNTEPGRYEFVLVDAPGRRRLRLCGADARRAEETSGDLAQMAALAPEFCSRADMCRFFHAYLGTRRLDESHRRLARDVVRRAEPLRPHELYRLKMDRVFHYHLVPGPAECHA